MLALLCGGKTAAQQASSPCPEVLIEQKYDHIPSRFYRQQGWDTAATCAEPTITLKAEPYIPVQFFNGYYTVEQIPYNPPDTTFSLGTRVAANVDDQFAQSSINIPYPFYFFGIRKTSFILGANGCVSFSSSATPSGSCPWSYSAALPWTDNTSGAPSPVAPVRDAIYGVYEDTNPQSSGTHLHTDWGIYYGIQDAFPCRKIICSWKDVIQYSCNTMHCTYQIVCYEGSNIIEVHVKERQVCSSWNGGRGIIGIQNATGAPQVKSNNRQDPNYYVTNGAPASFAPTGYNYFTTSVNNIAFRFTPQGSTNTSVKWYRIFGGGRDSVDLPQYDPVSNPNAVNDTNGYFIGMNPSNSEHPTLTQAVVTPKCVSRYVMELNFMNANQDWYHLRDTITIGIDTVNDMDLRLQGATNPTDTVRDICYGQSQTVTASYPQNQEIQSVNWSATRMLNSEERPLSTAIYGVDGTRLNLTLMPDPQTDTLPHNKIDSIYVQCAITFTSGCANYKRVLVRIFPNFDTTEVAGICQGQTYTWNPSGSQPFNFTQNTDPQLAFQTLQSRPGCDSIVRLALTVYDVSHTTDYRMDCKPITWIDGKVYSQNNQNRYDLDTIVLKNLYGCDSIVHLDFTIHPLTAKLTSSLDHFDLDHLDVVLTDISTGNDSRVWRFPTAVDQTGQTAYYTIPVTEPEAKIWLVAHSPYGCLDSTSITIPLNIETFWVPNAFTPENPAGNNIFSSISSKTIQEEMYIYNRFGQLVFHCEGVDCGWDGNDMSGNPCPQGGYVYVIRYTNSFEPDVTHIKKGSITLIR